MYASYNSHAFFFFYQKDAHRKPFLGFQREVIAALLFENRNGADMEIPIEENIIRLTERHFVSPVPERASKRKPQKRCKECYKKGVCKERSVQRKECAKKGVCKERSVQRKSLQLSELSEQARTSLFSLF